jgi:DNA topoisomerase-2
MWNIDNKIIKYDSVKDIIDEFCNIRLKYYQLRKDYLLNKYEHELLISNNKYRFILAIIDETIVIFKKKEDEINSILIKEKFDKINDNFDYLTNMQIRTFSKEKLDDLKKDIEKFKFLIKELKNKSLENLWIDDINDFENIYYKK